MEVLTQELKGVLLEWAVVVAIGGEVGEYPERNGEVRWEVRGPERCYSHLPRPHRHRLGWLGRIHGGWIMTVGEALWRPSEDWEQGGPLLYEHGIATERLDGDIWQGRTGPGSEAMLARPEEHRVPMLAAGMKALVGARLGTSVQVPSEVVKLAAAIDTA